MGGHTHKRWGHYRVVHLLIGHQCTRRLVMYTAVSCDACGRRSPLRQTPHIAQHGCLFSVNPTTKPCPILVHLLLTKTATAYGMFAPFSRPVVAGMPALTGTSSAKHTLKEYRGERGYSTTDPDDKREPLPPPHNLPTPVALATRVDYIPEVILPYRRRLSLHLFISRKGRCLRSTCSAFNRFGGRGRNNRTFFAQIHHAVHRNSICFPSRC